MAFNFVRRIKELESKTREIEQHNVDFKLVQELSDEISSTLELKDLLNVIMEAFVKAGKVSKGSLFLLDDETNTLEIKAGKGLSERAWKYVKPKLGEGIAGKVAETGETILINDTSKDFSLYKDFVKDARKHRPNETMICMPLKFKGRSLGAICLDAKIDGSQFLRNDERLLSILANQSAIAIQNSKLYEAAITDGMTKLYLHKYFFYRINKELEKAKKFNTTLTLIMIDIDHFKKFNDTYGHLVGDETLIHLAKIIKDSIRGGDIAGRYGGEEFSIILPSTVGTEAKNLAERLRKKLKDKPFKSDGNNLPIFVSIGIASFNGEKNINREELIKRADTALYWVKNNGRNNICIFEELKQFPSA